MKDFVVDHYRQILERQIDIEFRRRLKSRHLWGDERGEFLIMVAGGPLFVPMAAVDRVVDQLFSVIKRMNIKTISYEVLSLENTHLDNRLHHVFLKGMKCEYWSALL